MTNKEFYKEKILDIVCTGEKFAFNKDKNELCICKSISCKYCLFNDVETCAEMTKEWCNEEYVESCPFEKVN